MQMVCIGDPLHEMSNTIFWEQYIIDIIAFGEN